eukprot:10591796-Alexandrium_andersonii.AAC.1
MRDCSRRSKLELRRPRIGPNICTRSSWGVSPAPLCFALMLIPPTKRAGGRAGGASRGRLGGWSPPRA